ncbi:hypothetical protein RDI58_021952 [Solanum bulbocastanum]|uniref:Uncharacterized protein n=1 Tax=Solanum bulbocastanum TaxID=147425 RepID=A0AAN8T8I4_SOLBU
MFTVTPLGSTNDLAVEENHTQENIYIPNTIMQEVVQVRNPHDLPVEITTTTSSGAMELARVDEDPPGYPTTINEVAHVDIPDDAQVVPPPVIPGRPSRSVKPTIWLNDYVTFAESITNCTYPIVNYVVYTHLSSKYQAYLSSFLSIQEPRTFEEASQHTEWNVAVRQEINALEENQT